MRESEVLNPSEKEGYVTHEVLDIHLDSITDRFYCTRICGKL